MAGFFPPALLDQIRAANDIVDVIGAVLPLKRAGTNMLALCPFHKERTPSFNVSPHKQTFHCFGCHKGGNVFRFIQDYENLTFPEAVRRLAERAKIPLEMEERPGEQQSRAQKDLLLQIHEGIAQRWQHALENEASGEIGRAYLRKRGVSEEAIKLFRLGCAPDSWDDTVNWAKSKGHDLGVMEQGGLIIRKDGGENRFYDRFRGRLMFPICDEQGRVVAFSGRVLNGDEKTAKYVNSPETPIFTKGKVFYGLDKSKRALLDAQFAVICEGQLDLIACFMAGMKNIVAPQGTAFTGDHARILKRYVEEVVLCFDSDTAGQTAAVRVLDHLLGAGLSIRVAVVPQPHDPDSFIKEAGPEAFQKLISQAEGFFDYYLNRLCQTNDLRTDRGQLAVLQEMAEALHKTGNVVLMDRYAQKTANRLGVKAEAVRTEFKKRAKPARPGPAEAGAELIDSEETEAPRPNPQELWLLRLMIQYEESIPQMIDFLDAHWIQNAAVRKIVAAGLDAARQEGRLDVARLLEEFEDGAAQSLISEISTETRPVPRVPEQVKDLIKTFRDQSIDRQITGLTSRWGANPEDDALILLEKIRLNQLKKQPLSPLPDALE